jgi:hypothetical protein
MTAKSMKTIVVTLQHAFWPSYKTGGEEAEDSDTLVTTVNDEDFRVLLEDETLKLYNDESITQEGELVDRLRAHSFEPVYPLQIDNVFTVWYQK